MLPHVIAAIGGFLIGNSLKRTQFNNGGSVLLAPNGKPSNLTPEQYRLVRTTQFKSWFGDWENDPNNASKVVDENGEPLVCFHGTDSEFYIFSEKAGHKHDMGFYGKGFYFTFNPISNYIKYAKQEAYYYGHIVNDYFIKAFNPFDFDSLSKYEGEVISYSGIQTIIFLNNIVKLFPDIADDIFVEKKTYNSTENLYDIQQVPISVLPPLIEKYKNDLHIYEFTRGSDQRQFVSAYLESKSEIVEFEQSDGTKAKYKSTEDLGTYDASIPRKVLELMFVADAIEKYNGISPNYHPEGYMTRYPSITKAIRENHDCILQTEYGDELVVFEPNQIKSAIYNTDFNAENPDVRYGKGGRIKIGNRYGDWAITDYVPLSYDDLGIAKGGVIKLVNQETIETIYIRHDHELRSPLWYISYGGVRIEQKTPAKVLEKLQLIWSKNREGKTANFMSGEVYDAVNDVSDRMDSLKNDLDSAYEIYKDVFDEREKAEFLSIIEDRVEAYRNLLEDEDDEYLSEALPLLEEFIDKLEGIKDSGKTKSGYDKKQLEEKFKQREVYKVTYSSPKNWETYYDIWEELTPKGREAWLKSQDYSFNTKDKLEIINTNYRLADVSELSKAQVNAWILFTKYGYQKADIKRWNKTDL